MISGYFFRVVQLDDAIEVAMLHRLGIMNWKPEVQIPLCSLKSASLLVFLKSLSDF